MKAVLMFSNFKRTSFMFYSEVRQGVLCRGNGPRKYAVCILYNFIKVFGSSEMWRWSDLRWFNDWDWLKNEKESWNSILLFIIFLCVFNSSNSSVNYITWAVLIIVIDSLPLVEVTTRRCCCHRQSPPPNLERPIIMRYKS